MVLAHKQKHSASTYSYENLTKGKLRYKHHNAVCSSLQASRKGACFSTVNGSFIMDILASDAAETNPSLPP